MPSSPPGSPFLRSLRLTQAQTLRTLQAEGELNSIQFQAEGEGGGEGAPLGPDPAALLTPLGTNTKSRSESHGWRSHFHAPLFVF